jgi:hypothetical protein
MAEKMELVSSLRGRVVAAVGSDGPPEGEITRLAYPLRQGSHWTIRSEPFLAEATVEGMQRVRTPAGSFWAWRIRIERPVMGPNDEVLVWWGRVGMVAIRARFEGVFSASVRGTAEA